MRALLQAVLDGARLPQAQAEPPPSSSPPAAPPSRRHEVRDPVSGRYTTARRVRVRGGKVQP